MARLLPPTPDRSYLQVFEVVEYDLDLIKKALRLGSDDPDPSGFRAAYKPAEHLLQLIKVAAIQYERQEFSF